MLLFFFEELGLQYNDSIEIVVEKGITHYGHYLGEHDIGADTFLFLNVLKERKERIVISEVEKITKLN